MLRTVLLATVVFTLCACSQPVSEMVDTDGPWGDQCFYELEQRPADCFARAPCMWADMRLDISPGDAGSFNVDARQGGWPYGPHRSEQRIHANASSAHDLARQLPLLLADLHHETPNLAEACVLFDPDQSLRVQDVVALYGTLRERTRKVQLTAQLADDD